MSDSKPESGWVSDPNGNFEPETTEDRDVRMIVTLPDRRLIFYWPDEQR